MENLPFNFAEIFVIEKSVFELIFRGLIFYFGILFLMRIMPRRTGGELAIMDLVFILLIAEAATHSLGGYSSVTEGFIVILTLVVCDYSVNWLSSRSPFFERLVSAPPLQIIKSGKILRRNMRKEFITDEELHECLRKEGVDSIEKVKTAFVESDGKITVIKKSS